MAVVELLDSGVDEGEDRSDEPVEREVCAERPLGTTTCDQVLDAPQDRVMALAHLISREMAQQSADETVLPVQDLP